jgi:hypothetical protein
MVFHIARSFHCRLDHVRGSREVRLSRTETDDRFARSLQGLCSGIDRKGR